ncbi:hypothetical protein KY348_02675 [Candidatus Woesearchaeota archaeon]|nr:hypothetical protein [Candidatus Woesearchaeota archaeon]
MKKILKWLSSIFIALTSVLGIVLADVGDAGGCSGCGGWGMMGGWMPMGFGMGYFGWIIWLLVVVALILLIIWLIKQIGRKNKKK